MATKIQTSQVKRAARGRRMDVNPALVEALELLDPQDQDSAVVLDEEFGAVEDTNERSKIQSRIRSHYELVHGEGAKCSVIWNPETNFAQVFPSE